MLYEVGGLTVERFAEGILKLEFHLQKIQHAEKISMQVLFVTDNPDNQVTFRCAGDQCLAAIIRAYSKSITS
jgi:hypothetical protein